MEGRTIHGAGPVAAPQEEGAVAFGEVFRFRVRLGFVNFGGPAGQVAIMHRELVERRAWISEEQFLRAMNFCMLLPGPEAQQLATYVGWRMYGVRGGPVAGSFFVIPSVFVLLLLSYLARADAPVVAGLLYGVQPVVIVVVAEAVMRVGRRSLGHPALLALAALSFVAIYLLSAPFPLVVALAALAGPLLSRPYPEAFRAAGTVGTSRRTPPERGPCPPQRAACGSWGCLSYCGPSRSGRWSFGAGAGTCSCSRRSFSRGRRS